MVTISKNYISNLIIFSYLNEKRVIEEKLLLFEKKYMLKFEDFEKQVKNLEENFEHWDDYIEWKAYINFYQQLIQGIENVKSGDFQLA